MGENKYNKIGQILQARRECVFSRVPLEIENTVNEFLRGNADKVYRYKQEEISLDFRQRKDLYSRGFNDQDVVEWLRSGRTKPIWAPFVSDSFRP